MRRWANTRPISMNLWEFERRREGVPTRRFRSTLLRVPERHRCGRLRWRQQEEGGRAWRR